MVEMLGFARFVTIAGVAFSIALLPCATRASELCSTKMSVRKNGDVVIEGVVYSDRIALKARLAELKARNPDCFMSLVSEKGTEIKTMERVASIMRELGIAQVGFLTEPRNP
jgi:biopolymer transport protein ExbD